MTQGQGSTLKSTFVAIFREEWYNIQVISISVNTFVAAIFSCVAK